MCELPAPCEGQIEALYATLEPCLLGETPVLDGVTCDVEMGGDALIYTFSNGVKQETSFLGTSTWTGVGGSVCISSAVDLTTNITTVTVGEQTFSQSYSEVEPGVYTMNWTCPDGSALGELSMPSVTHR